MLKLEIKNLREIDDFSIELPYERGVYAITGENGIGKSTIFSALSKVLYRGALTSFFRNDGDNSTSVTYELNGKKNTWIKAPNWKRSDTDDEIFIDGTYEASIIFGQRFNDLHKSKIGKANYVQDSDLTDADDFVKENLGQILKCNPKYYNELKVIKTKALARELKFDGQPYFRKVGNKWLSQFFMSSGELLLIGMLHFINDRIKYKSSRRIKECSLMIIDEIEIALHPSAQERLAKFLHEISSKYNFCIYFATHSVQIINNIRPSKINHIKKGVSGGIEVVNPCYPAYAARSLYSNDGFDFLFLVEDELALNIINRILTDHKLRESKLIKVLPCGSWDKTLEIHYEFMSSCLPGKQCKIYSILDGDIKDECEEKYTQPHRYSGLGKSYLPIKSIEKYVKEKLIDAPNAAFFKEVGDDIFTYRSLEDIVADYKRNTKKNDSNGKILYLILTRCAEEQGYSREDFNKQVCNYVYGNENFGSLVGFLKGIISSHT
ncbi:ATP-dependent nuclease [Aeromonas jandaei]|uniref:ATP-dependent nuclease n=1 Tax=Aeromonas jandaei TaxID=650 RepID=UPI00059E06BE|nr:AAA family ATPase [Aeromonas jandaei]